MEHLYTTEEAAAKLKIHHETMRDYLRDHKIAGVKFGRVWRVRESDLNAFINRNVRPAKPNTEAKTNDMPPTIDAERFIDKLEKSKPVIAAGLKRRITSEDISNAIADARP